MPARPGRVAPGRRLPAVLLVVLAALAPLLGATAAVPAPARTSLGGAPAAAGHAPFAARLHGARETRATAVTRRASRGRSAPAARSVPADAASATRSVPVPTPVVLAALVLLAVVLLRTRPGRAGWSSPGRTPGWHRGRAPPAYALA